ncbi:hypothetical protein U879_15905 [Defluviimonas sp. 20V17]|uniref:Sel1 repeat family protein n=1 Tax=Allgaiera indica TaxID=765699 RepID=A0AAN5A0A7_9RHOB|nr:hypothetical protein [Allgaiera indica]KDB02677.1 hypothetical protein U879_15905 [Defluviimonas sp. 20V17]GHE01806.1 hypothetical protein GCM10008024_19050 [Allgaiera indica]SDW92731.1 hypothetical protein SAMN05444006_10841 [Allgaiera indica]
MRRLLLAAALTAIAPAAQAEVIAVRTGEHDGFSRVVLPLAEPAEGWQFGRLDDGYQLRLGRGAVQFDLSRAFDKIPKTRLAAISADDATGRLTLRLACACHAEIFPFRSTRLVIDIRPGAAPANSPFERPLPPDVAPRPRPPVPARPPVAGYDWREVPLVPLPAPPPPKIDLPAAPNPAIARGRAALLNQLSRAGAQGLIEIDPRQIALPQHPTDGDDQHTDPASAPPPKSHAKPPSETADARMQTAGQDTAQMPAQAGPAEPTGAKGDTDGGQDRLRIRTVLDRDAAASAAPGISAQGGSCPPDEAFAIETWADDTSPAGQFATRRRALVGEFDRPGPDAVGDLARTYLHFGFGAEARNVLTAFPNDGGDTHEILLALSAIFDEERPKLANALSGLAACPGKAALWSMLAVPPPAPGDPVDAQAVRRNFSGLPLHLRRMLGPRLSNAFLVLGDTETARALRASVTRAAGKPGPGIQLLDARIDIAEGRPERAEAQAARVVAADGALSAEAMVLLIESRTNRGEPVDPRRIEAVAALAHVHRGTQMGARLTRAQATALASVGRFTEAFAVNGKDPSGRKRLWQMLAANGDDEALLKIALQGPDPELDAGIRLQLSDRLLALGFARAATAWLDAGPVPDDDRRLRLARAALERRDGLAALDALGAMEAPEAQLLRARALGLTGAHRAAAQLYAALGKTDRQGVEAWRGGDWATARETGTKVQRKVLSLPDRPPPAEAASAPLAYGRALISSSREARAALDDLLEERLQTDAGASHTGQPAATPTN